MSARITDIKPGMKFGRLTVIEYAGPYGKGNKSSFLCRCECGNKIVVVASNLKSGNTKSCGCYRVDCGKTKNYRHGEAHQSNGKPTRLYAIWTNMNGRCYTLSNTDYRLYGAVGIKVCDEWRDSYEAFKNWAMATGYNDTLTLDRIDNAGDYTPLNCRWATHTEQCRNRRTNVFIVCDGERKTIAEWATITGIKAATIARRKRVGWTDVDCIKVPPNYRNNHKKARKRTN